MNGTAHPVSKFWRDVIDAHTQVSNNHSREIEIVSDAEDLTARVGYDNLQAGGGAVVIYIAVGSDRNTSLVTTDKEQHNA